MHLRTVILSLLVTGCGGGSADSIADAAPGGPDAETVDAAPTLEPGLLGPTPYLSRDDSPFAALVFTGYFHLEDVEDDLIDTPGLTADSTTLSSSFGAALVDSVDGDDGATDDACADCNALFGNGSITLTFAADDLAGLPTHVGVVWTDGGNGCDASFEAFDADDVSLGVGTAPAIGDALNTGETGEDRFFGVVAPGGVARVVVSNTTGGTEVDHIQYGR